MWSFFKLVMWGLTWFLAWILTLPLKKADEDNCLTYALNKWDTEGGYLVIRWCRSNKFKWIRWPHFLWLDQSFDRVVEHYVPVEDDSRPQVVPKPWFKGRIVYNDPEDHSEFRTDEDKVTQGSEN